MAQTGTAAGTGGSTDEQNSISLPDDGATPGYVEPILGRVALRDVSGYFGFPIIKKGETVTRPIAERAQSMSRLFELIAATDEI